MQREEIPQEIITAARLIKEARLAVVFTGAGISTPSGIPDFRGSSTSLWSTEIPMEVASLTVFQEQPERFFKWFHPLAKKISAARPNPAHIAIAELEKAGFIRGVITQNIDRLHQEAGSRQVYELHGSATTATCLSCHSHFLADQYLPDYLLNETIPLCPNCGKILKPDFILFEELLPDRTWTEAEELCQMCDVILIAGTSLEVVPAATLPMIAARNGAHLIINNFAPTQMDSVATVVIHENVEKVIPAIARILL